MDTMSRLEFMWIKLVHLTLQLDCGLYCCCMYAHNFKSSLMIHCFLHYASPNMDTSMYGHSMGNLMYEHLHDHQSQVFT